MDLDHGNINRENVGDQELVRHTRRLLIDIADKLGVKNYEHVGSVALHFYAGTDIMGAKQEIALVTQTANMIINREAVTLMMPEIRDRIFEAFGAEKQRLGVQTQEEVRDTGGTVVKTSLDS
jgi:hypothetical protein